jgi:hypothetical protein
MNETLTIGVTIERKQHSQISIEPRSVNKGGMVISYGNRDLEHCLLDKLFNKGFLGSPRDSQERYNMGYRLRDLWYSFNESGINLEQMGQGRKLYTSEGEIGVGNDALEAQYHAVMKALPQKYRPTVRAVCIDDILMPINQVIESLDALYGAFFRLDSK